MEKNEKYCLFLDDFRIPADVILYMPKCKYYVDREWVIARSYDEFVATILEKGIPIAVSLDHDLADEHYAAGDLGMTVDYSEFTEKTGYHCAKWLIEYCIDHNKEIPTAVFIHSRNMPGSKNIESLFTTYEKIHRRT
jgi:hypothetical protein